MWLCFYASYHIAIVPDNMSAMRVIYAFYTKSKMLDRTKDTPKHLLNMLVKSPSKITLRAVDPDLHRWHIPYQMLPPPCSRPLSNV